MMINSIVANALRLATKNVWNLPVWPSISIKCAKPQTICVATRFYSTDDTNNKKMVDPKRVVSYEDVMKNLNKPEKVIIDVRNPDEVNSTGKIPSSINIPLGSVQDVLSMSDEQFRQNYQRNKPACDDELIFYCRSGKRSTEALDKALKLGFSNSKTYLGSWDDWSSRQK
ncbi:rhodanese domain-containing protein CG4456 isoform X1 [Plutella xylostella]|uniref:rhodanese domain-containing protein CG4456 isoform X1 n=1 Tax=Plutella xylostella TaxID=51655 RepID=UPI002032D3B8|nr:rhodanese domain-containing protein CG4456 isoform X1 [Plutella xylostella]XP_048479084.1 rhodanese domain-containing protein CG4456 isoform X1 [Plutella xylostella]